MVFLYFIFCRYFFCYFYCFVYISLGKISTAILRRTKEYSFYSLKRLSQRAVDFLKIYKDHTVHWVWKYILLYWLYIEASIILLKLKWYINAISVYRTASRGTLKTVWAITTDKIPDMLKNFKITVSSSYITAVDYNSPLFFISFIAFSESSGRYLLLCNHLLSDILYS